METKLQAFSRSCRTERKAFFSVPTLPSQTQMCNWLQLVTVAGDDFTCAGGVREPLGKEAKLRHILDPLQQAEHLRNCTLKSFTVKYFLGVFLAGPSAREQGKGCSWPSSIPYWSPCLACSQQPWLWLGQRLSGSPGLGGFPWVCFYGSLAQLSPGVVVSG